MQLERRAEVYGIWLAILYLWLYLYSTYYNFSNPLVFSRWLIFLSGFLQVFVHFNCKKAFYRVYPQTVVC
jgi:hypothetical protein